MNKEIENADMMLSKLAKEGFFGEESKKLNRIRNSVDTPTFIYESALSIINTKYVNNALIYDISRSLLSIYLTAMKSDAQKTVDILAEFIQGTEELPESENFTSYKNYVIEKGKLNNDIKKFSDHNLSYSEKITLGNSFAENYSSAIELISKLSTTLLRLDYLIAKKSYKFEKFLNMSTASKLNQLNQSKYNDWTFITNLIDKNIRNAESHLDFSYDPEKKLFIGKYRNPKKNKYVRIQIPFEKFLSAYTANAESIIIGFFLSAFICYLSIVDKNKANNLAELM